MNLFTPKATVLLCAVLPLLPSLLFAQSYAPVQLSGTQLRTPLDVPEGTSTIRICDLIPGETYEIIANSAVQGQQAVFQLQAARHAIPVGPEKNGRANVLRFIAGESCADLDLSAASLQPLTTIPLYLSLRCMSCAVPSGKLLKPLPQADAANLSVAGGVSPENLITNTLIGGDCFEVSNITATGNANSRGTFANGATNIGLETGMILCTDRVGILPGPNFNPGASLGFGNDTPDDPDLAALAPGNQYDLSTIEFDFTPTANTVQFDFVFGSEEYCEYVGSDFNDVFGFFISGPGIPGTQNIALIPGSNTPVSTNNINYISNSTYYLNNTFFPPCTFLPPVAMNECELDGWTTVFTATADVIPCSTYHIKLAIADLGDSEFASAVFLRANSFDAGGSALAEAVYPGGMPAAVEGCDPAFIRFVRDNNDISMPLEIHFAIDPASTAIAGTDYAPLTSPVVIPAGQSDVLVPVTVFQDMQPEGPEFFNLLLEDACSCDQTELAFFIEDGTPPEVALAGVEVCAGQATELIPDAMGMEPFTYNWNTGDTSATLVVAPVAPAIYTVTLTDACGNTTVGSALVQVLPLVEEMELVLFCQGDSLVINGVVYTGPASLTDTIPGTGGDCDTVRTLILDLLPLPTLSDTILFCAGDAIPLNDSIYTTSGTAVDTLPGVNGGCDTIITYTLIMLPLPERSEQVDLCPDEQILIGGNLYGAPATVLDTVPGTGGGCDTILTYTLMLLERPLRTETILFCPGETVFVAGGQYTTPGMVLDTVPASAGCDTIVTYLMQYQTPAPSVVSIDCPSNIGMTVESGNPAIVQYTLPQASSDCPCPGMELALMSGLPSGSGFPAGVTTVCYEARDSCGNSSDCCFQVTVTETNPCDVKTIGCMVYELLSITRDAGDNQTYRIRVTNNCSQEMVYVAFELPHGVTAMEPANNSIYISPEGWEYGVRNPNFSPMYSIRFASKVNGLANGTSDIFAFKLPAQSSPPYIQVVARLATQTYYEAYLNTFFCPVGMEPVQDPGADRQSPEPDTRNATVLVYPNPTRGTLFLDLRNWPDVPSQVRIMDSRGRLLVSRELAGEEDVRQLQLPDQLPEGLYFLDLQAADGLRRVVRFALQR
ncbi:MAG: HYR domain-containing protein [Bacteroidetes bacterium]|nr:MAG: HYR domain-containing protein [Bacteroidota bacterium]